MNLNNFEVVPGATESSIILHVPHSSRNIPEEVRRHILLSNEVLQSELDEITDTLTDVLAQEAVQKLPIDFPRPWLFINRASRFVIDPERFPDEREIMNKVGMGAVYTKTTSGAQLRDSKFETGDLLENYFYPYANAFTELVCERLHSTQAVLIIDVHSYRASQHPNALNHGQKRPAMCIGTDSFHTPSWLRDFFYSEFEALGDCFENEPYAGTYVPLDFYQSDERVLSIMMETRADTFLDDDLKPHSGLNLISTALRNFIFNVHNSGRL